MKIGVIQKKEYKIDFEVANGSLYIAALGDSFPNLWGQKMNPVDKWTLIIENTIYTVGKDFYDSVSEGDSVEIYYDNGFQKVKSCRD